MASKKVGTSASKAQPKTKERETTSTRAKTETKVTASGEKKISAALLESIERRKKSAVAFGAKPGFRRGRRPKNVDYQPPNNEDEGYHGENELESIRYDTGIRLGPSAEEMGFSLDRFDDYDEELNFDR
jgi:hypothetical protein